MAADNILACVEDAASFEIAGGIDRGLWIRKEAEVTKHEEEIMI